MYAPINQSRLFFDLTGTGLRPVGEAMQEFPVLSVLHGSYVDHSYLKPPFEFLASDYQILYFDYRGCGRSDRTKPEAWHLAQQADDFIALLDHLGIEKTTVLAHSWGCHVASYVMEKYPERVDAYILMHPVQFRMSVLLDNLANRAGPEAVELAEELYRTRKADKFDRYFEFIGPLLFQIPPQPELFTRMLTSLEFYFQTLDELLSVDLLDRLTNKLDRTALVITGKNDPYLPADYLQELKQAFKKKPVEIIQCEESSHFAFLDEPELAQSAIKHFLNEVR